MAAIATPCTFPDEQTIVNFYKQEAIKPESFNVNVISYIPNGIEKIAEFFAGRTICRDEVESNVCRLFIANTSDAELRKVGFSWCLDLHTKILQDLFDKTASIPPKEGETFGTKQVEDLTKKKS